MAGFPPQVPCPDEEATRFRVAPEEEGFYFTRLTMRAFILYIGGSLYEAKEFTEWFIIRGLKPRPLYDYQKVTDPDRGSTGCLEKEFFMKGCEARLKEAIIDYDFKAYNKWKNKKPHNENRDILLDEATGVQTVQGIGYITFER